MVTCLRLLSRPLSRSLMRSLSRWVSLPLAAVPLLALTACTTPQQRAAQAQAEVEQMMVTYGPACSRLGYANDSDQWRTCILNLNARDELQRYDSHYYAGAGYGRWGGGWWGSRW
jgi:hypothetical protein